MKSTKPSTFSVNFSDVVDLNRMDAGYFNAVAPVRQKMANLEKQLTKEEVIAKLQAMSIPSGYLNFLKPIVRGGQAGSTLTKKDLEAVIKSDPYAVMALISFHANEVKSKVVEEIEALEKKEEELNSAISSFKP